MKKRVLITGASGFVGAHFISSAIENELEVFAAIRPGSNIDHLAGYTIHYTTLNYGSIKELRAEIEEKKYDYIIHAAGITKAKTLEQYVEVNAYNTKQLGLAVSLSDHKVQKFIFISSLAALGPLDKTDELLKDDSIAMPVSFYGMSKHYAEQYLIDIKDLPLIILRPTAVYGPMEKDLFIIIKSIVNGLEPYIGRIKQQLSFIYVKDLARIAVGILDSKIENRSYNLSDGQVYDRYELAENVKKIIGKKTLIIHLPLRLINGVAKLMDKFYANSKSTPVINTEKVKELTGINWGCDTSNIERDFAFKPEYSFKSGLKETIDWYKHNNWLKK